MPESDLKASEYQTSLFAALLDARQKYGAKTEILEDIERQPLTYDRLLLAALILGAKLAPITKKGEMVGVLLPNVSGVAVTFFALNAYGRIPAMLNFSAGLLNIGGACKCAEIKTVLTSKRFIEQAGLKELIDELKTKANIIWLEDIKADIGLGDKLKGLLRSWRARRFHKM